MKRCALVLALFAATVAASPAPHASPAAHATYHKSHVTSLSNPAANRNNARTMSGAGCASGVTANRAQLAVNPINGKAQAAPIVAVPLGKGAGSVADATTRAQQAHACAHTR